jgi:hypothetical protein
MVLVNFGFRSSMRSFHSIITPVSFVPRQVRVVELFSMYQPRLPTRLLWSLNESTIDCSEELLKLYCAVMYVLHNLTSQHLSL